MTVTRGHLSLVPTTQTADNDAAANDPAVPQQNNGLARAVRIAKGAAVATLKALRLLTWLALMYFVRAPLNFITRFAAPWLLIGGAILWFADRTDIAIRLGGIGFGLYVLQWLVDTLVLMLAPEPVMLSS